ncbi:hypothetical protein PR048_011207 [Dryococelus australis]|uniref:Uncharacterized protein n=1 Tax=Dryococelus australis TaxID=614101 RepID=A0ABQ9HKZ2_9NEOP|nr:hypothetical protein PR048_011207 [Dryococelus australis]
MLSTGQNSSSHVALLKIMLPCFDGNSKQWFKLPNLFSTRIINTRYENKHHLGIHCCKVPQLLLTAQNPCITYCPSSHKMFLPSLCCDETLKCSRVVGPVKSMKATILPSKSKIKAPSKGLPVCEQMFKCSVSSHSVCCLCHGPHSLLKCPEFCKHSAEDHIKVIKGHKLFLNSFADLHHIKQCPSKLC